MAVHAASRQEDDIVVIDSASDIHLFKSEHLLSDLQDVDALNVTGINQSKMRVTKMGKFKDVNNVYLAPGSSENILSWGELAKEGEVQYSQDTGVSVQVGAETMRFTPVGHRFVLEPSWQRMSQGIASGIC